MPISPLTEAPALTGEVLSPAQLTAGDRERMYALLATHFNNTTRATFEQDLEDKDTVLLLRDVGGQLQGFSTLKRIDLSRDLIAFFSGDTIVHPAFWGESLLFSLWAHTVFSAADRIHAHNPQAEVFWFLICSGYKTFRFLPVFFRTFYPTPEAATPPAVQSLLDTLAITRFGSDYDPATGIIRLAHATPLRPGVADLTPQRLRDPFIQFFAERNPGHTLGDELACLTPITRGNLTRAGERMLRSPLA
jgi:hypothetical protein